MGGKHYTTLFLQNIPQQFNGTDCGIFVMQVSIYDLARNCMSYLISFSMLDAYCYICQWIFHRYTLFCKFQYVNILHIE